MVRVQDHQTAGPGCDGNVGVRLAGPPIADLAFVGGCDIEAALFAVLLLEERGLWFAFPISYVIIALITMAVYARGDWKKKRLTNEDEKLTEKVAKEILLDEGVQK